MGFWRRLWPFGKKKEPEPPGGALTRKWSPGDWHYDDCPLKGTWNEGCWCEHRGPVSHYGGGILPGWHREKCPKVGMPWIAPAPDTWWKLPRCECQEHPDWGQYILTFQDGTIHGPAPRPLPRDEDCVVISGEEIRKILEKDDE